MRVVHRPVDGDAVSEDDAVSGGNVDDERVLATEVSVAEGFLQQARGLMFRRSIPDDYALVFPFGSVGSRDTHMLFVPFPIDAVWLVDGRVEATKRLAPWRGFAIERADTLIELPAGAADGVTPGDRIVVEGLDE